MNTTTRRPWLPRPCLLALLGSSALFTTCATGGDGAAPAGGASAFAVVYEVLQHPRCVNCHPAGDRPLVGDDMQPHPQNVQRGPFGMGLYALRCVSCHQTQNADGAHLPPGAPNWHLPRPQMPLVFEGRTATELARQLADPAQNGGHTGDQLLRHVAEDPLVLWGWAPGTGRTPVPIPHAEFVAAMRAWVAAGCPVPE